MLYDNYYWGMNFIWWFAWIMLLIWIFAIPYDIPGQRRIKTLHWTSCKGDSHQENSNLMSTMRKEKYSKMTCQD